MRFEAAAAIRLSEQLLALGVLQTSCQWAWRAVTVSNTPLLQQRIAEVGAIDPARSRLHRRWANRMTGPLAVVVSLMRAALAIALLSPASSRPVQTGALIGLVVAHVLLAWTPWTIWPDGGEGMSRLVTIALAVARIANHSADAACLTFLAGSVALAYFVPGAYKFACPGWRNGVTLQRVLRSERFGQSHVARLLAAHPLLSICASRALITWELMFSASLFLPAPVARVALAAGCAFHLWNAIILGIDAFVLPFLATYPAVVWLTQ